MTDQDIAEINARQDMLEFMLVNLYATLHGEIPVAVSEHSLASAVKIHHLDNLLRRIDPPQGPVADVQLSEAMGKSFVARVSDRSATIRAAKAEIVQEAAGAKKD